VKNNNIFDDTVILFRCYEKSKTTIRHFNKLFNEMPNVVVLYDCTGKMKWKEPYVFNFDYNDYAFSDYLVLSDEQIETYKDLFPQALTPTQKRIWYNSEYPVMFFYNSCPHYKYYWSVEYDTVYNGDWFEFFKYFIKVKSDLLGTWTNKHPDNTYYPWWWDMYSIKIADEKKLSYFGCLQRYSNKLLENVNIELLNGFHSFCEQTIPTICNLYDLKHNTINEFGREFFNPFTLQGATQEGRENLTETIKKEQYKNMLFHPIKADGC
jgi:hypothetical protein